MPDRAVEGQAVTAAQATQVPEFDNHHNAAVCPYCTHNGEFVMVSKRALDLAVDVNTRGPMTIRAIIEETVHDAF